MKPQFTFPPAQPGAMTFSPSAFAAFPVAHPSMLTMYQHAAAMTEQQIKATRGPLEVLGVIDATGKPKNHNN